MTARERAIEAIRAADGPAQLGGEALLAALEAAGLRVIDVPEAPYDVTGLGDPFWTGDSFGVVARPDGSVVVSIEPSLPGPYLTLTAELAAAISAAHIRAEDYR